MGSENSTLKRDALEEPPFTLPSGVNIYPAALQQGKLASVFVYKSENEDNVNKAAKHLKTLRHPCLLRFLSCTVEINGIHLVTERVQPVEKVLENLSSSEICAGIYDILQALVFLHDRGTLTHNNVCLSSVFVSEDGHWKLGGMETVCNQNEAMAEFLRSIESVREKMGIPPEEMRAGFQRLPEGQGHARDAYSFGAMVENLLTFLNEEVSEDVLFSFQQTVRSVLLNPDPMCRPPLSTLLSHEFFRFLLDRVAGLSEKLIALRLVPLLLNQLVFAEPVAVKSFLPHLLGPRMDKVGENQINGLLSPAMFQAHVSPVLLKLFEVHEEHVRIVLLSHLDAYAELFTQKELKNIILPQVLLGLRDTSDALVAVTLQSLGVLVSLLGPDVVVGGDRTKIFKCSAPSFTKTSDLSPEDSPTHIMSCQSKQTYKPLQNNPSGVLFKCPNSGNTSFSNKNHVPRQDSRVALRKGEQDASCSLNGVPAGLNPLRDDGSCPLGTENTTEEWPDWSECEEPETEKNATVNTETQEFHAGSGPCLTNHDLTDKKTWADVAHNPPFKSSSGNRPSDIAEPRLPPSMLELKRESRTLPSNSSSGPGSSSEGYDHKDLWDKSSRQPKASHLERSPKWECSLGEEFTIQVKKKESHDPELDWFADMVPDIKPASALLILPELGPHPVAQSNLDAVSSSLGDAQKVRFSSKFAAAAVTEVDDVGWEEEEELKWEDETTW
ncbi:PREDICTED: protein-associating with the carboxyl-terminal domain of ezrin [Gekko japonicus]|uniref:Protein-associating with the carboxyl-terminal domain of ezrin n=1 Tax=Gekko japonicus TaxID=146911 RepID=A0ABM1JJQ1_GEKJA|nr:PREDICTED: protein-associating with the carboxyl-terminal domain of ezrin [Gekko japonicus]